MADQRHRSRLATDSRRRVAIAAAGGVVTFVVVFGIGGALAGWMAAQRFPAPEQAAVWSLIGRFVAAALALAAAAQAWWWLRNR